MKAMDIGAPSPFKGIGAPIVFCNSLQQYEAGVGGTKVDEKQEIGNDSKFCRPTSKADAIVGIHYVLDIRPMPFMVFPYLVKIADKQGFLAIEQFFALLLGFLFVFWRNIAVNADLA